MKYQILLSIRFGSLPDASLTKTNALPTANITYPADGELFREGYAYTLRGMVGDPDNNSRVAKPLADQNKHSVKTCNQTTEA